MDANTKTFLINGDLVAADVPWDAPSGFGLVNLLGAAFTSETLADLAKAEFYIDDFELLDTTSLSLEENNSLDQQISMYPSPSKGQFTIDFNNPIPSKYIVMITDLSGRVIETSRVDNAISKSFDLNVSAGVYLVNITTENEKITRKIVIE